MAISATAPRRAFDHIEMENTRFVRMIVEIIDLPPTGKRDNITIRRP